MVFQVIHQIDMQDPDLARDIDQGGDGEITVQSEEADCIKGCDTDKTFIVDDADTRADAGDQDGEQHQLAGQMLKHGQGQSADFDPAYELVHKDRDIGNPLIDLAAAGEPEFELLQGRIGGGGHVFRFPDQPVIYHSRRNLAYDT